MDQNITFRHICPIQVRFTDVDQMGHVTNYAYLAYCDIARLEYLTTILNEKINHSEKSLVIASVTIDFLKPIFLHEKINVLTKTIKLGNKSMQTLQQIINIETEEVKAEIISVIAGFNYITQESIVIPDDWKKQFSEFDSGLEYKKQ